MTLWTCLTIPLDIFTIYSQSITLNLRNTFLIYIQRNFSWTKQILQTKKHIDFNIKVIGSDAHNNVYDKCDDFGFPIVNCHWLSGDVPRLPSFGVTFHSWLDLQGVMLAFRSSILKIFKLLTKDSLYHKLRKNICKVLQVTLWAFFQNFV